MQAYKKRNLKVARSFRHSAFASDSKIIKFWQWNLKFAKFKLQIINFLAKFILQLDKIWFKTPTQTLKFINSQATSIKQTLSRKFRKYKNDRIFENSYLWVFVLKI